MKKILILMVSLIMILAMSGCGSSGPQTYAGFYSAAIPEGFTANDEQTEFTRPCSVSPENEEMIQVYIRHGDAEEEINSSVAYWADTSSPHKRVEDVTYGDITWFVETYTWDTWDVDDVDSCTFYTNADNGDFIEVNIFLLGHDNEEVVAMMESFTFEEDAYNKNCEFVYSLSDQ